MRRQQPVQEIDDLLLIRFRDEPSPSVPAPYKGISFCVPPQAQRRNRKEIDLTSRLQVCNQIEFVAIPSEEEGTQQIDIVLRTSKEQGVLALEIRMIANLQRCHHAFDGK